VRNGEFLFSDVYVESSACSDLEGRAPFNAAFQWDNSSSNLIIPDRSKSYLNTFVGNEFQQTTSVVTTTNQNCYTQGGGCFSTYGFEYKPGGDGYIQWISDATPAFELRAAGLGPDPRMEIGQRPVPEEPMVSPHSVSEVKC
jgi:hypothetical protein